MEFEVFVDDNFHYRDEDSRYRLGDYKTLEEAIAACKSIVDEFLIDQYKPGITPEELYSQYINFGEDPYISAKGYTGPPFSAWDYAKNRSYEICVNPPEPVPEKKIISLTREEQLTKANEMAEEAYKSISDLDVQAKKGHLSRVMNLGMKPEERITGILNDLCSNSSLTPEELKREGFSEEIVNALKTLRKKGDEETLKEYLIRIKSDKLAVKVKLNDLIVRLDFRWMKEIVPSDAEKLNQHLQEYRILTSFLEDDK